MTGSQTTPASSSDAIAQALQHARLGEVAVVGEGEQAAVQLIPRGVHDVARVVSLAHRMGVRVAVTQRARPGLIALDLRRFSDIETPDETSAIVRAGAGVRVADVEDRAIQAGLTLGTLLPSTPYKKLGAWLAGPTRGERWVPGDRLETVVLALEAVLADGSVYRSVEAPRSATGPDLDHLLLGAEGRFGIITRATLRLHARALAEAFGSRPALALRDAVEALRESTLAGGAPAEARWSRARGSVEARFSGAGAAQRARAFGTGGLTGREVKGELELAGSWGAWAAASPLRAEELQLVAMHGGGAFGALRFADPAEAARAAEIAPAIGFVIVSPRKLRPAPEVGYAASGAAAVFATFAASLDKFGVFARD